MQNLQYKIKKFQHITKMHVLCLITDEKITGVERKIETNIMQIAQRTEKCENGCICELAPDKSACYNGRRIRREEDEI